MKKLVYFIGALVVLVLVLSKMVETPTTSFTDVKKDAIFIEDLVQLQMQLGHTEITTTMEYLKNLGLHDLAKLKANFPAI